MKATMTPVKPRLKPGTRLKDPDVVVLFAADTAPHLQAALVFWEANSPPYVTFIYNRETGGLGSGHYHADPEAASAEYFRRLNASQYLSLAPNPKPS